MNTNIPLNKIEKIVNKDTTLLSPKRGGEVVETIIPIKKKGTNVVNSKFDTSISYEESVNRSLNDSNHRIHARSPPERVKDMINLKKQQGNKTFKKQNLLKEKNAKNNLLASPNKERNDKNQGIVVKKYNEMGIIVEENEQSIKTNGKNPNNNLKASRDESNNQTSVNSKIENVVIDFKKNINVKPTTAAPNQPHQTDLSLVSKKSSDQLTNKQIKIDNTRKNNATSYKYGAASPQHKSSNKFSLEQANNKKTISNKSPERKMFNSNVLMDNLKAKNNVSTIPHRDRNAVARSISPLGKNNTTNSMHLAQEKSTEANSSTKETNNCNNINANNGNNINAIILDKLNVKKERRASNDQGKLSYKNSNNVSNQNNTNSLRLSIKKEHDNKKTLQVNSAQTKKESISINPKGNANIDIKKVSTSQFNNNTITISTINVDKDDKKGKLRNLKGNNIDSHKKPEQKKVEINLDKKIEISLDKKAVVNDKLNDGSLSKLPTKKSTDNLEKQQSSNIKKS